MTKSSQLQRQKGLLAGESKPENDQENFDKALQELMAKGHAQEQQIEVFKKLYRKAALENKEIKKMSVTKGKARNMNLVINQYIVFD